MCEGVAGVGGLHPTDFAEITRTVADVAGIRIGAGKEGLVSSRLHRRVRALGLASYADYVARVTADASGRERAEMVDLRPTNKMDFFRLATDLCRRALAQAVRGVYTESRVCDVPALLRANTSCRSRTARWGVRPTLRALVRSARLNLMHAWPMHGPFHAICCRNMMIYFDAATQQALVARLQEFLAPGGYLFVGHAESLSTISYDLSYVRPAVYRR